ncbi:unnamed protein product [Amoebophrya sp. A25]|nr:unnamed protein product [Amoebophrya sp. A25]|eukprot:GSA25T00024089001.1
MAVLVVIGLLTFFGVAAMGVYCCRASSAARNGIYEEELEGEDDPGKEGQECTMHGENYAQNRGAYDVDQDGWNLDFYQGDPGSPLGEGSPICAQEDAFSFAPDEDHPTMYYHEDEARHWEDPGHIIHHLDGFGPPSHFNDQRSPHTEYDINQHEHPPRHAEPFYHDFSDPYQDHSHASATAPTFTYSHGMINHEQRGYADQRVYHDQYNGARFDELPGVHDQQHLFPFIAPHDPMAPLCPSDVVLHTAPCGETADRVRVIHREELQSPGTVLQSATRSIPQTRIDHDVVVNVERQHNQQPPPPITSSSRSSSMMYYHDQVVAAPRPQRTMRQEDEEAKQRIAPASRVLQNGLEVSQASSPSPETSDIPAIPTETGDEYHGNEIGRSREVITRQAREVRTGTTTTAKEKDLDRHDRPRPLMARESESRVVHLVRPTFQPTEQDYEHHGQRLSAPREAVRGRGTTLASKTDTTGARTMVLGKCSPRGARRAVEQEEADKRASPPIQRKTIAPSPGLSSPPKRHHPLRVSDGIASRSRRTSSEDNNTIKTSRPKEQNTTNRNKTREERTTTNKKRSQSVAQQERPHLPEKKNENETLWFYSDRQGEVRGPFSTDKMRRWWLRKKLSRHLWVKPPRVWRDKLSRLSPRIAKRFQEMPQEHQGYLPIRELFADDLEAAFDLRKLGMT